MMRCLISLTLLLICLSSAYAEKTTSEPPRLIRVENSELGTYLKMEFIQEDMVRFESGLIDNELESLKTRIWESPMVDKQNRTYPQVSIGENDSYETTKIKVRILAPDLCAIVTDKESDTLLARFCPKALDRHWKQLEIRSYLSSNVYGLGQYFSDPGTTEGDWLGKTWDPLAHTMGNSLRPFNGGANGYAMFPIAYVLGKQFENYAIFLDNIYKQMWSFPQGTWKAEMFGDQIRWYVIQGQTLQDLRAKYMNLVGRPPMPPVESFGLWVSRFGFENWEQVSQELSYLRQNHFPIEGFALDLQWFGGKFYPNGSDVSGSRMGTLQFDRTNFRDPEDTLRNFAEREGIQFMPIEESYINHTLSEHHDLEYKGFLAKECGTHYPTRIDANPWWGKGGMLDWTNPAAGLYWHDTKREPLIDLGIRFHWTDLGEPEMYNNNACYYGFPELGKNRHPDIHNIYNLKWAESIHEGYRRHHPRERHYTLSRSGTSGLQRFGTGMWSGDIAANMGALTAHLRAQGHMSLSGIDYYGSDIGGFHRNASTLDGDENELYTQWFANSSLFDFPVRPHVWTVQQNKETSPARIGHVPSNLANLRLRYELFPYYYSLAWKAYSDGKSIVSPMVYEFQNNETLRTVGHQKMIGPSLMAAIVARYGERERDVYLPKGTWVDWHTGRFHDGKNDWERNVPTTQDGLFRLPLFLKGGAIIPLLALPENTRNLKEALAQRTKPFAVKVVPDRTPSAFTIYEDDYTSNAYEVGVYRLTRVQQRLTDRDAQITINPSDGLANDLVRPYLVKLLLDRKTIAGVTVNNQVLNACPAHYQSKSSEERSLCWEPSGPNETTLHLGVFLSSADKRIHVVYRDRVDE